MRKLLNTIALGAAIAAAPQVAYAQASDDDGGFYMAVKAGVANLSDPTVTYYDVGGTFNGTGATDTATAKLNTKSAFAIDGTIGYDFGSLRADVEVAYSRHNIDSLTFVSLNGTAATLTPADRADVCTYLEASPCGGSGNTFLIPGSRVRQLSAMGNLWLDLPIGTSVVPYVGGGLGISGFEVDGEGKGRFAWQLGAGVAFKLSPAIALTADFRHREVGKAEIAFDSVSGFNVSALKTNSLLAGLRVTF